MDDFTKALAEFVDPVTIMHRIAEQTRVLIPAADGCALCLSDGGESFLIVSASGVDSPQRGRIVPRQETFIDRAFETGLPQLCRDSLTDPRLSTMSRDLGRRLGIRSSLSISLVRRRASIGVLSVDARLPDAFTENDVATITGMSGFISTIIEFNTELAEIVDDICKTTVEDAVAPQTRFVAGVWHPELAQHALERRSIREIIASGAVETHFQVIIDLRTNVVRAMEALSRFDDHDLRGPDHWFTAAHAVGQGVELERLALRRALERAGPIPKDKPVGVNLSATALLDPDVRADILSADRSLVVELTEHEHWPDALLPVLDELRRRGVQLAVDDAGAGFSGLTQILKLRPDIIKLDRYLTADIDEDPVRRALVRSLVHVADELGAVTVGEGIENERQRRVLSELGIGFGQGYGLGRPCPVEEILALL